MSAKPNSPTPNSPSQNPPTCSPREPLVPAPPSGPGAQPTVAPPPDLIRLYDRSRVAVRWFDRSPLAGRYQTARGPVDVFHGVGGAGKAAGVEICVLDSGAVQVVVLPGRGMSIWQIRVGETAFGWRSPVDGPVHPALVPLHDPDGLGWLEGFDELLVRCGLESNGAPEKHDDGSLRYPLHGRIANLPARDLAIEVDPDSGQLSLVGDVYETKLFFKRLQLRSRVTVTAGATQVQLADQVTNQRSVPAEIQMLYHINVGSPVLSDGGDVVAPIKRLAPKDDLSAGEINQWNQTPAAASGYGERVYFCQLHQDADGQSTAMLRSGDRGRAIAVSFDHRTLPYFIFWKNTAADQDGYVAGLEPATNFPNSRSAEAGQGRLVRLPAAGDVTFRLTLDPLVTADEVSQFAQRIRRLSELGPEEVLSKPDPHWSV